MMRACVAMALLVAVLSSNRAAAKPVMEKFTVYEAGKGGYAMYRIPGLVVTPKGALLIYCEARKGNGDWDRIDVLLRRSTDGGKTWDAPRLALRSTARFEKNPIALARKEAHGKAGEITVNNPVAITDPHKGVIHFVYCVEYMRCFYQRSDDDGLTFSRPVEITSAFEGLRRRYDWKVLATGPGHGIQLKNGRLLVPIWLSTGTVGHGHRPSAVSTLYSDDDGRTWHCGDIVAEDNKKLLNPSETTAVELADGRVLLNVRNESREHRRAVAVSPDGATHWTAPVFDDNLKEPVCMGSLCRLSRAAGGGKDRLLFANPDNLEWAGAKARPDQLFRDRKNLTVKLSYDEGKTWALSRPLEPSYSGYSDLAVGPDGMIYCFYESGVLDGPDAFVIRALFHSSKLTLARFNLEWLTSGKDVFAPSGRP